MRTLNIYLGFELIGSIVSSSDKRIEKHKNRIVSNYDPSRIIIKEV